MPARTTSCVAPSLGHVHSVALSLLALGCAMAIAACGGSGSAGTGPQGDYNVALKFSQCMRAHGLADFPDPSGGGAIQIGGPGSKMNPQSPSFRAAQKACARYGPSAAAPPHMTEAQRVAAVKFATCVRSHGYPDFPDPSETIPHGRAVAVLSLRGMLFAFTGKPLLQSVWYRLFTWTRMTRFWCRVGAGWMQMRS